jgi:hypothetical protein
VASAIEGHGSAKADRLEADGKAIPSIEMALKHARELNAVGEPERTVSLRIWIACLERALECLNSKKVVEIRTVWLERQAELSTWNNRYFQRFERWHEQVVAKPLIRMAREQGLIPLSLEYVPPSHHGTATIRVVPYRKQSAVKKGAGRSGERPAADLGASIAEIPQPKQAESQPASVAATEASFVARFGFDAPPRIRAHVEELKARYEFTDRELRYLKWAGALSLRCDEVNLRPSPALFWTGCALLLPLAVALFHAIVRFIQLPSSELLATALALGVIFVYVALAWLVYWTFCSPYFLLKRRMSADGAAPSKAARKEGPRSG